MCKEYRLSFLEPTQPTIGLVDFRRKRVQDHLVGIGRGFSHNFCAGVFGCERETILAPGVASSSKQISSSLPNKHLEKLRRSIRRADCVSGPANTGERLAGPNHSTTYKEIVQWLNVSLNPSVSHVSRVRRSCLQSNGGRSDGHIPTNQPRGCDGTSSARCTTGSQRGTTWAGCSGDTGQTGDH